MAHLSPFILSIFLAALIAFAARKLRFLTISGAIGAFILGSVFFTAGGLTLSIPLLAFFISSSLLSHFGKRDKEKINHLYEKGEERDIGQVLANGTVPGILALLFAIMPHIRLIPLICLASLAAMNADTWATEIGAFSRSRPRMVTTFRQVEAGISGAISLLGIIAAIMGSLFVAIFGWLSWNPTRLLMFRPDMSELLAITWTGFLASYADSILGASIQSQYRCKICGKQTETQTHCGKRTEWIKGWKWVNNDVVNLIASLLGALFCWFLLHFYGYPE